MGMVADYALRISNLVRSDSANNGKRRINFQIGNKFNIPKDCEYVEVSFNMGRLVFRFLKDRYRNGKSLIMKRVCKITHTKGSIYTFSVAIPGFVELMNGWEGEYDDILKFPQSNPEEFKFYLKRDMKHSYTNTLSGSSSEYNQPKNVDIPEEPVSKPVEVPHEECKEMVNKGPDIPIIPDEFDKARKECEIQMELRDKENELCMDILKRAEECTAIMSNGVSALLEHRFLRRKLSIGESEGNAEFNKIVTKYIKLEMAIKDLMYNVRHTWDDGRGLYDAYKNVKEDYPDMDISGIANFLHVTPDELQETIEAVERILGSTKERAKIGFTVED